MAATMCSDVTDNITSKGLSSELAEFVSTFVLFLIHDGTGLYPTSFASPLTCFAGQKTEHYLHKLSFQVPVMSIASTNRAE